MKKQFKNTFLPAITESNTADANDMDKMIAESISRKNNGKIVQEQS